jgi:hypothetical protein
VFLRLAVSGGDNEITKNRTFSINRTCVAKPPICDVQIGGFFLFRLFSKAHQQQYLKDGTFALLAMSYAQRNPYPLQCFQGEDRSFIVQLKKKDGTAYDLSGAEVKSEIRKAWGAVLADLNATVIDAIAGKVRLTITAGDSVEYGRHYYDIRIYTTSGVDYLDPSSFTIMATITKP